MKKILFVLLIVIIITALYFLKDDSSPSLAENSIETSQEVSSSNLRTYNSKIGFSVKYPSNFAIDETIARGDLLGGVLLSPIGTIDADFDLARQGEKALTTLNQAPQEYSLIAGVIFPSQYGNPSFSNPALEGKSNDIVSLLKDREFLQAIIPDVHIRPISIKAFESHTDLDQPYALVVFDQPVYQKQGMTKIIFSRKGPIGGSKAFFVTYAAPTTNYHPEVSAEILNSFQFSN